MKNPFKMILKKLNQKELLKQIMEYINDPEVKVDRAENEEWLIEFKYCTDSPNLKGVSKQDLERFRDYVFKKEPSEFQRLRAATVIRKFYKYAQKKKWVKNFPTEDPQPTTKDTKVAFMNKLTKGWINGPMPNKEMIKRVRRLRNVHKLSFRKICGELEKELGKKIHLASVFKWYNSKRV